MLANMVTSMELAKTMCSYEVFHKLTALMMPAGGFF
jgi:hypothetical protein